MAYCTRRSLRISWIMVPEISLCISMAYCTRMISMYIYILLTLPERSLSILYLWITVPEGSLCITMANCTRKISMSKYCLLCQKDL